MGLGMGLSMGFGEQTAIDGFSDLPCDLLLFRARIDDVPCLPFLLGALFQEGADAFKKRESSSFKRIAHVFFVVFFVFFFTFFVVPARLRLDRRQIEQKAQIHLDLKPILFERVQGDAMQIFERRRVCSACRLIGET